LLAVSWFFKYPDIVTAEGALTGENPPADVVAKVAGKITALYVKEGQIVAAGDRLAVIENPASTDDVMFLKDLTERIIARPDSLMSRNRNELKLGTVQSSYSAFAAARDAYAQFEALAYYPAKIKTLEEQAEHYKTIYANAEEQHRLTEQQYEVSLKRYFRDSTLFTEKALSAQDMEEAENRRLQSKLTLENSRSSLENLSLQIMKLNESLLDIRLQYSDRRNLLLSELANRAGQLAADIKTWEMMYLISSPAGGAVTSSGYWSENRNVTAGETVFTIVPQTNDSLTVKVRLPSQRSGKVKAGQRANVRFVNYPDNEFGMVKGVVESVSPVPSSEGIYTVYVNLPAGLITNYNKTLPFSQAMQAQVDIVTEDLRLLERLFLPIKKIVSENRVIN
jgi:HlyD family secretion protein